MPTISEFLRSLGEPTTDDLARIAEQIDNDELELVNGVSEIAIQDIEIDPIDELTEVDAEDSDVADLPIEEAVVVELHIPRPPTPTSTQTSSPRGSSTVVAIPRSAKDLSPANYAEEPEEITDDNWHEFGNCRGVDPDLFFPERGASTREAKEVCRGCVVRDPCLESALANGEKFGIWGGMSERERRRLRRQRAIAKRKAAAAEGDQTPKVARKARAETRQTSDDEADDVFEEEALTAID